MQKLVLKCNNVRYIEFAVSINISAHLGGSAYLGSSQSTLVYPYIVDTALETGIVSVVGLADETACSAAHICKLTVCFGGVADFLAIEIELCICTVYNERVVVPFCGVEVIDEFSLIAPRIGRSGEAEEVGSKSYLVRYRYRS